MNTSFQILISVGVSPLTQAPLISDSPCHSTTLPQPQTEWVVLSEANRTYSGGCRYGEAEGNTPSLRRFRVGMTSLFLQSYLNQWHQYLLICPKNMSEQETYGPILFAICWSVLFKKKKKALGIARNILTDLTSSLILNGCSCLVWA